MEEARSFAMSEENLNFAGRKKNIFLRPFERTAPSKEKFSSGPLESCFMQGKHFPATQI